PPLPRPGGPAPLSDLRGLRRRGRASRPQRVGALPAARSRRGGAAPRSSRAVVLRDDRLRHHARFVAALFLVSLALRPQIIGAGPLIPSIQSQLGISHTVAGLLGTIPVLCMGIFAPAAAYVAGAVGARTAIAGGVALVAAGGLLRVSVPNAAVLVVLTLPVGIGIALAGSLMPAAVKARLA